MEGDQGNYSNPSFRHLVTNENLSYIIDPICLYPEGRSFQSHEHYAVSQLDYGKPRPDSPILFLQLAYGFYWITLC